MTRYHLIFETISGSQLYGTALPTSDIDYRGVGIEDIQSLLGFHKFDEEVLQFPIDRTIFSLRKFLNLALDANPNIMELLFAPVYVPTCIHNSNLWMEVMAKRECFLSQKIRKTFVGYAYAQLKKMEVHYKWMTTEAPTKPNPKDYGQWTDGDGHENWSSHTQYQDYQTNKKTWENYSNWLANRNKTRHDTELKWGYDTKFGLHAIRLLSQGKELLETGFLTLPRPDAQELLAIRHGKYTYPELVKLAEGMLVDLDNTKSDLPEKPDYETIENLSIELHRRYLKGQY